MNQMYDVFIYNASGTLTLEAVAWTNNTTRATSIIYQDGVYCKSSDLTHRYVGSFSTWPTSGQTADTTAYRFVWNYYNRLKHDMEATNGITTWTYSVAAWRQANANTNSQVNFVIGVGEDLIEAILSVSLKVIGAQYASAQVGIGVDSITAPSNAGVSPIISDSLGIASCGTSILQALTEYLIGSHYFSWLEYDYNPTGALTFIGGTNSLLCSALRGSILC